MRLTEPEARSLLLIRAVEDTDQDGVLLPPRLRVAATRRVFDDDGAAPDEDARLRARAALLRDDLLHAAPGLARVLAPPRWRGALLVTTLAVATVAGALANLLGPERHVSVLAFPLAGILAWNVLVYLALATHVAVHALAHVRSASPAPGRLARVGRWLEAARLSALARRLGGSARSLAVTDAVKRFQRLWLEAAAPLVAARVRVALHLGALAMALGAIAGLYASGIAFEYRATWESTWLEAPAVQRYLDLVLGPAARLLGRPVPDVAPLRGPGGDSAAAPWIHLWGATLGLFVVLPRAALALVEAVTVTRLSRRLPVDLDAAYRRRALHSGRGAATVVEVVYYSCAPDAALRARLHTLLQEEAGARATVRDGTPLAYGDGAERVALPETTGSGLLAVVFALAQTPEPEVHGQFLERLQERLARAGWQLTVVLEGAVYRQRVGSDARVRERRATWERLLRDLELTAVDLA
jgi:hypothetical protein